MSDAATPVAASAPPVGESAIPVAQSAGPVTVSRPKGRPFGKDRKPLRVMAELLPVPTGSQIMAARLAAGQTQTQAAKVIGSNRTARWSDYEGEVTSMPAASWTWYLLATGQHPALGLKKKRVIAGS